MGPAPAPGVFRSPARPLPAHASHVSVPETTLLRIRAVPNASKTAVVGRMGGAVKVKLKAVPEGGRANAELCEFLADTLGVGRRAVTLESGDTSRDKRVRIAGVGEAEVLRKLGVEP